MKDLLSELGLADEILEVEKKNKTSRKALQNQIGNFRADIVISPHRSFRTAFWVAKSGASLRVGFKDLWTAFAYNLRVKRPNDLHDVLRQASLLSAFGVKVTDAQPGTMTTEFQNHSEEIPLTTRLPESMPFPMSAGFTTLREAKAAGFKPVVLAPGSQWKTKQWSEEGFTDVAREMLRRGKKVVLVGSPAESLLCETIAANAGSGIANICGKTTIAELASLMSLAEVVYCNDSGALHVASLSGVPVVTVFGPTVPAQGYAPWNKAASVVEEAELQCRPCGAHGHQECPIGTHDCMKHITAARVLQAGDRLASPKV